MSDLRGDKRTADVAYPRHIAMFLCRELTEASLPQIGARFGGRDDIRSSTPSTRSTVSCRMVTIASSTTSSRSSPRGCRPAARAATGRLSPNLLTNGLQAVENVAWRRQTGYACRVRSRVGATGAPFHTLSTRPSQAPRTADAGRQSVSHTVNKVYDDYEDVSLNKER